MKPLLAALLALGVMAPALAQTPTSKPLDLKLRAQDFPVSGATAPGVYYGDTSGKRVTGDDHRDTSDTRTHVSGTLSTSIGYAKGFGTATSSAATLDLDHSFDNGSRVDLHLGVRQSDGFQRRWPYHDRR
jgi:hypothetical protein